MKKEIKKTESINEVINTNVENNEVNNNTVITAESNEVDELMQALQQEVVEKVIENDAKKDTRRAKKQSKFSGVENWLLNRMNKILEHPMMSDKLLEEFAKMIEDAKDGIKEREIKRIDDEIARLTALKKSLK